MERFTTVAEMRAWSRRVRAEGRRLVFIPTLGGLHAGHEACFTEGSRHGDLRVISIYLNPIQFDRPDDLDSYPADLDDDLARCAGAGIDAVFTPATAEFYPDGFATFVQVVGPLTDKLCGGTRPGHFRGVCTVVCKLFNAVEPDVAVFGEKDLQQTAIVRRMVADLSVPVEIVLTPTVRDADGLAFSSRNRRLDAAQRDTARALPRGLELARRAHAGGQQDSLKLSEVVAEEVLVHPDVELDYVDVVRLPEFAEVREAEDGDVLFAAIIVDGVRLIDHVVLGSGPLANPLAS